jgi:16S rRNA (cytidine1402-2'-O)-methyltransferase
MYTKSTIYLFMTTKIWLIPNALHAGYDNLPANYYTQTIPSHVQNIACSIDVWLVENAKTARAFLNSLNLPLRTPLQQQKMLVIGDEQQYVFLQQAKHNDQDIGVLSEAGLPAIADPGANVVEMAHQLNIEVMPLVGPCSILLALMASGLNGQSFTFHGYLPIDVEQRRLSIQQTEKHSRQYKQTQICIETPYRNIAFMHSLIEQLHAKTRLCIAVDLTLPTQKIMVQTIEEWKKNMSIEFLHKKPCIFLWLSL